MLTKTPAQTVDSGSRVLHGAMVNPTPATEANASSLQALDGRAGADATLTASDTYSAARAVKYPLSLKPADILLASASDTTITRNRQGLLADNLSLTVREGAALAAGTMAPRIARSAPSILTMTGPFDINAIEAGLTRYSAAGTSPPADFEPCLTRIEKFDPGPAMDRSAATGTKPGYEGLSPAARQGRIISTSSSSARLASASPSPSSPGPRRRRHSGRSSAGSKRRCR